MAANQIAGNGKKYRYAIILGLVTFFGALLLSFLAVKPLYDSAVATTKNVNDNQEKLNVLNKRLTTLKDLSKREQEIRDEEKKISQALPQGDEVGRLFIQVDQLVGSTGGKSSGYSKGALSTLTNDPNLVVLTSSLSADFPSYFNLKDFIGKANSALRLLNISGLNVRAADNGQVNVSINTTTYSRK